MKKYFFILLGIIAFAILLPVICVLITGGIYEQKKSNEILVYIADEDKTVAMDTEQYIKEVISAEMPAEFELEALKAQAVAARTYLASKTDSEAGHDKAVICTDSKHCQAWISEKERKEAWEPEKSKEYWDKISKAAEETKGEILTYNGRAISAVFHSASSGKTENSADVWGGDMPYLVSVDSEGDLYSPKLYDEREISVSDFISKIKEKYPEINEKEEPFSEILRSEAGGIIKIRVYGYPMKGTELRSLLELKSTNMELTTNDDKILIKTKGNGHGVGMSQYGANYYAQQGKKYDEILKHYYSGVQIEKIS